MLQVGKILISDEVIERHFVCDLNACKGACCVEGDMGAPLEMEEIEKLEEVYEHVESYLTSEGKAVIENEGVAITDMGELTTPTINKRECAYAFRNDEGILKCAIEQAHFDGKISWKKPISCHLYPIRVSKLSETEALNYDRWSICADACTLGEKLKVPVFVFVKEALIRKYGEDWYKELEVQVNKM